LKKGVWFPIDVSLQADSSVDEEGVDAECSFSGDRAFQWLPVGEELYLSLSGAEMELVLCLVHSLSQNFKILKYI